MMTKEMEEEMGKEKTSHPNADAAPYRPEFCFGRQTFALVVGKRKTVSFESCDSSSFQCKEKAPCEGDGVWIYVQ